MDSLQQSNLSRERQLNWRLLLATLLCAVVGIPAILFWHRLQLSRVGDAMQARAEQWYDDGEYEKAADYFYRCYQLAQRDPVRQRQLVVQVAKSYDQAARTGRQRQTAIQWYQRAAGMLPESAETQARLAELYLETRQYGAAAKQAITALQRNPDSLRNRRILPLAQYHQLRAGRRLTRPLGGLGDLPDELVDTTRGGPAERVFARLNAVFQADRRDVEVAEAMVDLLTHEMPEPAQADPVSRAESILDLLVRAAPDDYRAYLSRYRFRDDHGKTELAQEDLTHALELAPDQIDVLFEMARHLDRRGQFLEATALYDRLIQLHPHDGRFYHGLGESKFRSGQVDQAIGEWQRGLARASTGRLQLQVSLIAALIHTADLKAAEQQLKQLDQAITFLATGEGESQRDEIVASRNLLEARLRMAENNETAAVPLLRRVRDHGGVSDHLREEAAMRLGTCLLKMQSWKKAAAAFEEVLQLQPRSVSARLAAAQAWVAEGSRYGEEEAIRLCTEVVSGERVPEQAWNLLAQLHLRTQLGRPPEQRTWRQLEQVLQQARQALPDSWQMPWIEANLALLRDGPQGRARALQILVGQEQAHPDDVSLWANLVFFYERLGLSKEADRAMAWLARLTPESPRTLAWQVMLLAGRGEVDAANRALGDAAAKLNSATAAATPDVDLIWLERARTFVAYETGNPEIIREALLQAYQQRTNAVEVVAQLAELALEQQDGAQCDRWIQRLRELEGDQGSWWRFFLGRRYLQAATENAVAAAQQLAEQLQRLRPWWAGTAMLQGLLAEQRGDSATAVDAYVDAIRSGFSRPAVYERLVGTLYRQGRFEEANQWLLQLQTQRPLNSRLLDLASSAALERDQADWARRLAEDNVARNPDDPASHLWLAHLLETVGQHAAALDHAQRARRLGPRRVDDWMSLLSFYLRVGETNAARDCLQTLRQESLISPATWQVVAAQTYQRLGDYTLAERHYREALEALPDDLDLQIRFAVFRRPFDIDEAEQRLRDVLRRDPTIDKARRLLAIWLAEKTEDEDAEVAELLQTESPEDSQQVADRRLQAVLLMRRGSPADRQQAIDLLERVAEDARFVQSEDRVLLAQLYEQNSELDKAEAQLRQLVEQPNPPSRDLVVFADFLLRQGRIQDARPLIAELQRVAPLSLSSVSLRSRLMKATRQDAEVDRYLEGYVQQRLSDLEPEDSEQRTILMQQAVRLFTAANLDAGAERWLQRLAQHDSRYRDAYAQYLVQRSAATPAGLNAADGDVEPREGRPIEFDVTLGDPAADAALLAKLYVHAARNPTAAERQAIGRRLMNAVTQYPNDADLLFSVASFQLKFGETPTAISLFRQLTQRHPQHLTAWNNLAAILADDPQRMDEAARCIDRALAAAGYPVANLLDTKAVILLRQDQNQQAADLLHQALSLPNGNDPRFHFHHSVALRRLGNARLAADAWDTAKRLGLFETYLTLFDQQLVAETKRAFETETSSDGQTR